MTSYFQRYVVIKLLSEGCYCYFANYEMNITEYHTNKIIPLGQNSLAEAVPSPKSRLMALNKHTPF